MMVTNQMDRVKRLNEEVIREIINDKTEQDG